MGGTGDTGRAVQLGDPRTGGGDDWHAASVFFANFGTYNGCSVWMVWVAIDAAWPQCYNW